MGSQVSGWDIHCRTESCLSTQPPKGAIQCRLSGLQTSLLLLPSGSSKKLMARLCFPTKAENHGRFTSKQTRQGHAQQAPLVVIPATVLLKGEDVTGPHLVRTVVLSASVSVTDSAALSASPMRVTSPARKHTPCCAHRCSRSSRSRRRHTLHGHRQVEFSRP